MLFRQDGRVCAVDAAQKLAGKELIAFIIRSAERRFSFLVLLMTLLTAQHPCPETPESPDGLTCSMLCRERWMNHKRPGLIKAPWMLWEDFVLAKVSEDSDDWTCRWSKSVMCNAALSTFKISTCALEFITHRPTRNWDLGGQR